MPVVEDLVADCASIASVHIQFWDPSHHEKPDVHKTAMKCEIAYLGTTLQDLPHRTKLCLAQQHDQLYTFTLWISPSVDGGSTLPSKPMA